MPILQKIAGFQDDVVSIRRDIHRHPEIGFEEVRTAAIVAGKLDSWGIEVHAGIGKTGEGKRGRRRNDWIAGRHGRAADA